MGARACTALRPAARRPVRLPPYRQPRYGPPADRLHLCSECSQRRATCAPHLNIRLGNIGRHWAAQDCSSADEFGRPARSSLQDVRAWRAGKESLVPGNERMFMINGAASCVEMQGGAGGPAVLLVGSSMLSWPDELCKRLVAGGRRVIRYDGEPGARVDLHQDRGDRDAGQQRAELGAQRPGLGRDVLGGQRRDDQFPVPAEADLARSAAPGELGSPGPTAPRAARRSPGPGRRPLTRACR